MRAGKRTYVLSTRSHVLLYKSVPRSYSFVSIDRVLYVWEHISMRARPGFMWEQIYSLELGITGTCTSTEPRFIDWLRETQTIALPLSNGGKTIKTSASLRSTYVVP